ncbi:N-acetylglucosamine-binding protein GbpA [Pleionea sp. CnH1-48]|uniref:N-acetylglucosamine-binding protein GbpA n=1 Tax=Pleionea sp. CnH1-48 TaxID=2954494 RepID=UPI0020976C2B|nr:N-acetylglucosamine-binding protein GbpA [Pleionea sp. CnH1-48]MCO7223728.1 N-acetylglucosamine-binding protein GbpA [Pleionea sp. CnH1-48]
MKSKLWLKAAVLSAVGLVQYQSTVHAHGYMSEPKSRGYLCKLGSHSNCGAVQWEPQSIEGGDRYPTGGPADGTIASAGLAQFSPLNVQTSERWHKVPMQSGRQSFSWHFTANHVTRDWRYYITKVDWNPNQPLSRGSFEPTPFCEHDGFMQRPPVDTTHECNVPQRSGYHVILGVWDVGDTAASFYNVIDAEFGGVQPPTEWKDIGDIFPSINLTSGDKVHARVFDDSGELAQLKTTYTIDSEQNGKKNIWPYQLAKTINQQRTQIKAGKLDSQGNIKPNKGRNDIFAKKNSRLKRVEVEIETLQQGPDFAVEKLDDSYLIKNGTATVVFDVTTSERLNTDVTIFDANNLQKASSTAVINGRRSLTLDITNAAPMEHTLVLKVETSDGTTYQKSYPFNLVPEQNGEYDYIYPNSKESYKEGTKVLARDGKVYQCKPFPFSGWCTIYTPTSNHYEPGSGSHWQNAWVLISP